MQTKESYIDKFQKNKFAYGIFIWLFISIAYLLFIANWGFGGYLAGNGVGSTTGGYLEYFKIDGTIKSFQFVNQATNWAITIGRGIGSVAVALLLAKLFHKYTTIIALSLTLFGIPAQFLPGENWGYVLFLILRTFMAIGGTMMIILTQPVVSNFFNKKQKSVVSQFGIWFYPLGIIISVFPYVVAHYLPHTDSTKIFIMDKWQWILTILAALNALPLLVMILFGSRFDVPVKQENTNNQPQQNGFKILGQYLRKKATYSWVLLYGGWLCAVVLPTALSHTIFPGIATHVGNIAGGGRHIINEWYLSFLIPVFFAPLTVGLWSRYHLKRKWYIGTMLTTGIVLYVLSMLTYAYGVAKGDTASRVFFYILGFLSGLCLWGIQGVMLNTPHEYKGRDVKAIGWMFSLIWGLGFIFYTLSLITISLIPLIAGNDKQYIYIIMFVILVVSSLLSLIGVFMLKEPDPEAKTFPWSKSKNDA
nr:hexose phosphate transporter [Mycoplasma tauri]